MTDPARMPQFEAIVVEMVSHHPKVPREDIRQEGEYLLLHPDFGGNWAYFRARLNWYVRKFEQFSRVARQINLDSSALVIHEKPKPSSQGRMTSGQKRRFRRDTVIQIAATSGVSGRILAEVFNLPRSRIAAILASDLHAKAK
jgi:hypothetical protein